METVYFPTCTYRYLPYESERAKILSSPSISGSLIRYLGEGYNGDKVGYVRTLYKDTIFNDMILDEDWIECYTTDLSSGYAIKGYVKSKFLIGPSNVGIGFKGYGVYIYALDSNKNYTLVKTDAVAPGSSYSIPDPSAQSIYEPDYGKSYGVVMLDKNDNGSSSEANPYFALYDIEYLPCGYNSSLPNESDKISGNAAYRYNDIIYDVRSDIYLYVVFKGSIIYDYNFDASINHKEYTNIYTEDYKANFYNESNEYILYKTRTIQYSKQFLGWSTSRNGSIIPYEDRNMIVTENLWLYAIWGDSVKLEDTGCISLPPRSKDNVNGIYTTIFNTNGNSLDSVKSGYTSYIFDGWYDNNYKTLYGKAGENFDLNSSNNNINMYAKFTAINNNGSINLPTPTKNGVNGITYNVTMNPDNGEQINTIPVSVGKKIYSFLGWYEDSDLSIPAGDANSSYEINSDKELYAKWDEININGINISDPNNKPSIIKNDVITNIDYCADSLENYSILSNRTISYYFDGWYNGSYKVTNIAPYIPTSDVTLKAKWNSYITYDSIPIPTDEERIDNEHLSVLLHNNYNDDIIRKDTERTVLYNFVGMFTKEIGGINVDIDNTGYYIPSNINNTLYAHWDENYSYGDPIILDDISRNIINGTEYTIYYNGNSGNSEKSSDTIIRGRTEYLFDGWFNSPTGGTEISSPYMPTQESIDLYAHWTTIDTNETSSLPNATKEDEDPKPVTVRFNTNGGIITCEDSAIVYVEGKTYKFIGWYDSPSGGNLVGHNGDNYIPLSDNTNINLYAHWECINVNESIILPNASKDDASVIVQFDGNGGIVLGNTENNTVISVVVKGKGYRFDGWYDDVSNGNFIGSNGNEYTPNLGNTTVNLYAHWTEVGTVESIDLFDSNREDSDGTNVLVRFNTDGGIISGDNVLISKGKKKYKFAGWYDSDTGGNLIGSNGANYTPDFNRSIINLYAHWNESNINESITLPDVNKENDNGREVSVTFDAKGGTVSDSDKIILSTNIEGKAYSFTGWYDSDTGVNKIGDIGDEYTPNSNTSIIDLYAHWNETIVNGNIVLPNPTRQDINEYRVTIDAGEGLIGDSNIKSVIARRGTNYAFKGWYLSPYNIESEKIENPYTPIEDGITLEAVWLIDNIINEPITFETPVYETSESITIRLYENKSSSDNTYTDKEVLKVVKKDFNGWYLDGERLDASANTYMPSKDNITIIAKWSNARCNPIPINSISRQGSNIKYTINLNNNGGITTDGISELNAYRNTIYNFEGWYDARGGVNIMANTDMDYVPDPDSIQSIINMYAHWKIIPSVYRVALPNCVKNGYSFLGWSTDQTRQNIVVSPYIPASDSSTTLSLYAIYTYKGKIKINGKYYIPIIFTGGKWYKLLAEIFKNGNYREAGYKDDNTI